VRRPDTRDRRGNGELGRAAGGQLTDSQQRWLRVRSYLREHRYDLAAAAGRSYPESATVEGTPLLTAPGWLPAEPVPLRDIDLRYVPDAPFSGVTGTEEAAQAVLPVRPDGSRYRSYSEAVGELAAPRLFENRRTYRLLSADLHSDRRMVFGPGSYFDGVDVGDACAHEYAAAALGETPTQRLRAAVGDPCDPARRPTNVAISTLTLRHDRTTGEATLLLHRRDAAAVGHAGGMYQVLPVGIFQPAGEQPWHISNDFSLWRCMVREFAEELLGEPEDRSTDQVPIDYDSWPFAARMTESLDNGRLRAYCLGLGVDPLTFATDVLTVVAIDAPLYDELFGQLVTANAEGSVLSGLSFTPDVIDRFTGHEPTQAAGAALLRLAWRHRNHLLA
jgi:hypothetical protein